MTVRSRPGRLTLALIAAAAALSAVIAAEWRAGMVLRDKLAHMPTDTATPPPLAALPPFSLPPLARFGSVTARPLFTATRRPPPPPDAATPPRRLVLTGISASASGTEVLVRDLDTGKTERVRSDAPSADGLQVLSATPASAVRREGGATVTLTLDVAPSAGAQPSPPHLPVPMAVPMQAPLATPAPAPAPAPKPAPALVKPASAPHAAPGSQAKAVAPRPPAHP